MCAIVIGIYDPVIPARYYSNAEQMTEVAQGIKPYRETLETMVMCESGFERRILVGF